MASRLVQQLAAAALAAAWLATGPACGSRGADARARASATAAATAASTACGGAQRCVATDAHAKHQATGFDCVTCHPCGGKFGFDTGFAFTRGTVIQPTDAYTPATGTSPASCTVACHYPMGSTAAPVSWGAPAPLACVGCHEVAVLLQRYPDHPAVSGTATRADCETCHVVAGQHTSGTVVLQGHPAAWMDRNDPGFHAFAAERGLATCQTCHLNDLSGGTTGHACSDCHRAGGTANDFATCTACHGGTADATGAPPAAIWGQAGDPSRGGGTADPVRVGAHTAHVNAGAYGPAFPCETCHVKPASLAAGGHIDVVPGGGVPTATVTFGGLAVNGGGTPAWDRPSATCSSTYCHGATLPGGAVPTINNPSWTGGASQVYCGSCHGVPPAPPHVAVDTSGGFGVCNPCHSFTVDAGGAIIPAAAGGKHLNGLIEASGHDANWLDRTSPGFHAFSANRGIKNCTPCHGADLAGGSVGVGCTACHNASGPGNDFATCTACHGGQDGATGAPPVAIWGFAGDPLRGGGDPDPIRVGAHTRHLAPSLSGAFGCGVCHVKPASLLSPGHIDDATPVATVTFGGIATAVPAGSTPAWARATASCSSTYCHGNYAGQFTYSVYDWGSDSYTNVTVNYTGLRATPVWTSGPMTCGSCHGNPPRTGTWHSGSHGGKAAYNECQLCHPDASSTNGVGNAITTPSLHVNGVVDVTPKWSTSCFGCH